MNCIGPWAPATLLLITRPNFVSTVDRGEVVDADAEAALRIVVEGDEVGEGRPLTELELLVLRAGGQPQERPPRGIEAIDLRPERPAQHRDHAGRQVRMVAEERDLVLQVSRAVDDVLRRGARRRIAP
jgi:hypothetical protein